MERQGGNGVRWDETCRYTLTVRCRGTYHVKYPKIVWNDSEKRVFESLRFSKELEHDDSAMAVAWGKVQSSPAGRISMSMGSRTVTGSRVSKRLVHIM
jgi:hypothetical protein